MDLIVAVTSNVKSVVTQKVSFIELWKNFCVWPSFDNIMCIGGS